MSFNWILRSSRQLHPHANRGESPAQIARKLNAGGSHNIPTEEETKALTKKRYRPPVYFTGRKPGHPGLPWTESGSGSDLHARRPDIPHGAVWCGKCNCPCDFSEGGLHNLMGRRDSSGHKRGYILIQAECHGEIANITVTFEEVRNHAGQAILAFPYPESVIKVTAGRLRAPLALPAPPQRLLLRGEGENYWTMPFLVRYEVHKEFAPVDPDKITAFAYLKQAELTEVDEIMRRFNERQARKKE